MTHIDPNESEKQIKRRKPNVKLIKLTLTKAKLTKAKRRDSKRGIIIEPCPSLPLISEDCLNIRQACRTSVP